MIQWVVLNIFMDTFGNILTDVMFGVFILIGILLGVFLRPLVGNRVLKMDPSDHRFWELNIAEESAITLECQETKGIPLQRFFKHHPGFTGIVGRFLKKPVTMFLGRTGTAYTWRLESGIEKKLGSLADALKTLWGEDFYGTIPETRRTELEKSEVGVTVGLATDPLTPTGMKEVSEENIKQEEDRVASRTFWKERGAKDRGMYVNIILAAGLGFGVCAALVLLGIFKSPGSTSAPATTPAPTTATQAILYVLSLVI